MIAMPKQQSTPLTYKDVDGSEMPDLDAARREAIARIRATLNREAASGEIDPARYVEITDAQGVVLDVVKFSDVASDAAALPDHKCLKYSATLAER
jgi:hypothetical protein